jgi:hypothetical protein
MDGQLNPVMNHKGEDPSPYREVSEENSSKTRRKGLNFRLANLTFRAQNMRIRTYSTEV